MSCVRFDSVCMDSCRCAGRQLARRLVLELLVGELFCAALSTPERHGVLPIELHLSAAARHNLVQVATLLNTVAASTLEAAVASAASGSSSAATQELVRFLYEQLDWVLRSVFRTLYCT